MTMLRLFAEDLDMKMLYMGKPVFQLTLDHVIDGGIHFVSPSRGSVSVDAIRLRSKGSDALEVVSRLVASRPLRRGDGLTITFNTIRLIKMSDILEDLANEAEEGYDPEQLQRRETWNPPSFPSG